MWCYILGMPQDDLDNLPVVIRRLFRLFIVLVGLFIGLLFFEGASCFMQEHPSRVVYRALHGQNRDCFWQDRPRMMVCIVPSLPSSADAGPSSADAAAE